MKDQRPSPHILMILENEGFPDDTRVNLEATALHEAGFRVSVICPRYGHLPRCQVVSGVQVYRYPPPWNIPGAIGYALEFAYSFKIGLVYALWVWLRHGFDAIHIHCPPDTNALIGWPFRLLGKKLVIDLHDLSPELYQAQKGGQGSGLIKKTLLWFERRACRIADALIATNNSQRQVQIERGGASPERCVVVRNGPNEMFHPEVSPRTDLVPSGMKSVGYVGVIGIQDGVDYFVRAISHLVRQRDDVCGVIVGDGPARISLQQLCQELGIADRIVFTGMVPFLEVPSYLASFDVCVTPDPSNSYNDSCTTIKTMEYMALGKPTVAFRTRENEITAGEAALYAEGNDVTLLASRIDQLLEDESMAKKMGEIGLKRIKSSLAWAHQRDFLINLYRGLLGSSRQHSPSNIERSKLNGQN